MPSYDREQLGRSVVHLGVGGFHRAHQAVYFDELAEQGISSNWGITGIVVRRPVMRDRLAPQAGLYTVLERGESGDSARVVGALRQCLFAQEEHAEAVAALADPAVSLVTLTITGNAYEPQTGPDAPALSAFGLLAEGLDRRRMRNGPPLTVLSCDNLPDNGRAARDATLRAARRRSDELAQWVLANVAFPCSVVDRITPEAGDEAAALVRDRFGIEDRAPVATEPFSQWIIEDSFMGTPPRLDLVGARFVTDVADYALIKKRMLNGGHCALGYLGTLLGHETTDEAMRDPLVAAYLDRLLAEEIQPLLPTTAGLDLDDYRETLLERFANPKLGDALARLCRRGSTKMPAYLLPSVIDARRAGRPHRLLALAVACWARYLRGFDLEGEPLEITDARLHDLQPLALAGGNNPRFLLRNRAVFGELAADGPFTRSLANALESFDREGLRETIADSLTGDRLASLSVG